MEPVESPKPDAEDHRLVILIVEDDFLVRWPAAEYLRDAGYRVIEASSVNDAIAVFSCNTHVDIVFSDINLPGELTGHELAHWLGQYRPQVPMLLTSGAADAPQRMAAGANRSFLGKPYLLAEVDQRIKEMLPQS
jgi:CheY-like chemotaxis protein